MGDVDEFNGEGTERQPAAHRHDLDRDLRRAGFGQALGLEQRSRERRGIERHVESRPQIDESADVVLVAVREHETEDVATLLHEKADVGQDEIDARQLLLGGKGDAAIDDDPLPAPLVAEAIDREVHPDLADAAERREHEFILRHIRPVRREQCGLPSL
jgi:hypothetical protein